jgi:hypothetical protein
VEEEVVVAGAVLVVVDDVVVGGAVPSGVPLACASAGVESVGGVDWTPF